MPSPIFARMLRATERGAFPRLRRAGWKLAYTVISGAWRQPRWRFMNYGYIPPGPPFVLDAAEEAERAFIGLYHQAVQGLDLRGAALLEVGSGHGGGAAWLARHTGAASVIGVDLSAATVAKARALNRDVPGLVFRQGDAEALPFLDGSFDAVVNIESSHCYGRMDRFVAEAARVLRPGGVFTWADMRSPAMLPALDAAFAHPALERLDGAELNDGVLAALDAMEAEKAAEIARQPAFHSITREFAAMRGSTLRGALERRQTLYLARRFRRH
jgi:ubiquinone/menaquinone biosynthesis C-methylase UbiE